MEIEKKRKRLLAALCEEVFAIWASELSFTS